MQLMEKRTYDQRIFDFDCTDLLGSSETITSVTSVTADQGVLTFGSPAINSGVVTYPDGSTAVAGKVVQVQINDGVIPDGVDRVICTVRARFVTSHSPQLEATALLVLTDTPE